MIVHTVSHSRDVGLIVMVSLGKLMILKVLTDHFGGWGNHNEYVCMYVCLCVCSVLAKKCAINSSKADRPFGLVDLIHGHGMM